MPSMKAMLVFCRNACRRQPLIRSVYDVLKQLQNAVKFAVADGQAWGCRRWSM